MYWHIAEEIETDRKDDELTLPNVPCSPKAVINKLLTQSSNLFLMHQTLLINKTESQECKTEGTDVIPGPVRPSSALASTWTYAHACQHTQLQGGEEDKGRRTEIDGHGASMKQKIKVT